MTSLQSSASTRPSLRLAFLQTAFAATALGALSACGGGGSSPPPTSTVSSASVAASRYGQTALITMSGTNLDSSGLSVTSTGCKNVARLTSGAGTTSTATNAYYSCTVSGAFSSTVLIQSNGATIANPAFTVPAPQVKFSVADGVSVAGDIVLTLEGDKVPATVDNFLAYVNSGFYDNTIFHRIAKLTSAGNPFFVMQGGGYGPTVGGNLPTHKTTNAPIAIETAGGNNVQWTIAMGNAGPNTVTSEFFINAEDNTSILANNYSVFGSITTGIDVAQSILAAVTPSECVPNGLAGTIDCLPQPDMVITAASQVQ